jgi:hypothetical protein
MHYRPTVNQLRPLRDPQTLPSPSKRRYRLRAFVFARP